jgi:signal transduction histidine kinase
MSDMPHIVAVDDEPRALELVVRSLRKIARVSTAASGDEALGLLRCSEVDLVLTDQRMPGMSGIELLRRAAEHDETVGRVLLTGYTDLQASVDAINLGRVHAYLHKPCVALDLQATVTSVLQRVALVRENARLLGVVTAKNQELERALEALRASQARTVASERLAAIGRMIAMIVHDLRSPLTAIRSSGSQIASEAEASAAELAKLGRIVVEEADHLQEMCSELLEVSQASDTRPECRPDSLDDAVDAALAMILGHVSRPGVDIQLDLASHAVVALDDRGLRRILQNLVRNAVEANPGGGVVRVETRVEDSSACLSVSDSGPGIPPEIADRLFEPFVTFGKSEGTGLGLAVVQRIVEALGGSIRATKASGGGARFEVRLPLVARE